MYYTPKSEQIAENENLIITTKENSKIQQEGKEVNNIAGTQTWLATQSVTLRFEQRSGRYFAAPDPLLPFLIVPPSFSLFLSLILLLFITFVSSSLPVSPSPAVHVIEIMQNAFWRRGKMNVQSGSTYFSAWSDYNNET